MPAQFPTLGGDNPRHYRVATARPSLERLVGAGLVPAYFPSLSPPVILSEGEESNGFERVGSLVTPPNPLLP